MKKLSNLDDELLDLDEESEEGYDSYEDDYDDDYEEHDYVQSVGLAKKIIVIAAAAASLLAVILIVTIVIIPIFFGISDTKEAEPVIKTDEIIVQDDDATDVQTIPEEDVTVVSSPEDERQDTVCEEQQEISNDEQPDPQDSNMSTDEGTEVNVTELLSSGSVAETNQVTIGIDVAKYQGTIDWTQVASSGIDFAMVRVGYRADTSREICADTNAKYNMQEASANGIKIGAYFFSTATTVEEAKEEANWVADYISQYQITYPVAYDCEGFDQPDSAQYNLTNAQRTDIAIAFLQEIYNRGYTPMFYSSMGELSGNAKWDTTRIEGTYRIWVSQYPSVPYPQTAQSSYG